MICEIARPRLTAFRRMPPVPKLDPNSKNYHTLCQKDLQSYFLYEADGTLRRKCKCQWPAVGSLRSDGYKTVTIRGKHNKAHRIVWTMHNGTIPEGLVVDHINGDRSDNRIENLRLATRQQNQNNTMAVALLSSGMWEAKVRANGISYVLGEFESAAAARDKVSSFRSDPMYLDLLSYPPICGGGGET